MFKLNLSNFMRYLSYYANILLEWEEWEKSAVYPIFQNQSQNNFLEEVLKFVLKSFKYLFDRILLKFRKFYYFAGNIKCLQFESLFRKVLTSHICIKE